MRDPLLTQEDFDRELERTEAQRLDAELVNAWRLTFDTPHGRIVFKHLIERCHVFSSSFTGNSKTFFLEGEREVGLYLIRMRNLAHLGNLDQIEGEALEMALKQAIEKRKERPNG